MDINKTVVEKFLRVAISILFLVIIFMITALLLEIVNFGILIPAIIACAGVIFSFGVHLNKLHNRIGKVTVVYPDANL